MRIVLEQQKSKYQFYLDSADVIDILDGIHIYYSDYNNFDKEYFEQEKRVVQTLAYAGLLKDDLAINLLPTHQAELLEKIRHRDHQKEENTQSILDQMWFEDLALLNKVPNLSYKATLVIEDDNIKSWVHHGKGESLFKAIHLSDRLSWESRFHQFISTKNSYCQLTTYSSFDIEVFENEWELFRMLVFSLRKKRDRIEKAGNNYRDALALLYIARKVRLYNDQMSNVIPIYFDSQDFSKFISPDILDNYFSIETNGETTIKYCVLMPPIFFKVYALLKVNPIFPDEDAKYRNFLESLKVIVKSIKLLDKSNVNMQSRTLVTNKEEIEEIIAKYLKYDFFRLVLLDAWRDDGYLKKRVSENLSGNPKLDDFQLGEIRNEIARMLNLLYGEMEDFIYWSSKAYNSLERNVNKIVKLNSEFHLSAQMDLDIFYHFSLFRFNIPIHHQKAISVLFSNTGLFSKSTDTRDTAFIALWKIHFEVSKKQHEEIDEEKLFVLFSSFWILNMHDFISHIKINFNISHHSLLMLNGACLYRVIKEQYSDEKRSTLHLIFRKILSVLVKRRADFTGDGTNRFGEISTALSYLWFHLWLQEGGRLYLENSKNYTFVTKDKNEVAIKYAKEAFEFYDSNGYSGLSHKLYALNLILYFTIDSCPDETFLEIEDFISLFLSLKSSSSDWHFRFDDTISRNFHRLSLIVSSKERKAHYARLALEYLQRSLDPMKMISNTDIGEIRNYSLILEHYCSGFEI